MSMVENTGQGQKGEGERKEQRGDYKRRKQRRIRYTDKGKNAVQVQRGVSRTRRKGNKGQGQRKDHRKGTQRRIQDKDKRGEFRTGKKLAVQPQRVVPK
jgi:hypothetical protein